jgi:lysylphosphatidylglycerol synthetase-like protein (DUF2156 family)
MDASRRRGWVLVAVLVGVVYFVIGRVFAQSANYVHVSRIAAWILSLVAYATHIWYELSRRRSSVRSTALHAAVAVAIGAFGLAMAGMIRSSSGASAIRPAWLLALLAWPVITGVPAFLCALAIAAVLRRSLAR